MEAKFEGIEPFLKRLRKVEKKSRQRTILRSSLNSGLGPIKTEMRKAVRSEQAIRTRALYKAIYSKVKGYPSGVVVMIVGVKDKRNADGENPGKYFHLVDLGTKPHAQTMTPVPYQGGWIMRGASAYQHPGSKSKPIRDPAAERGGPKVADRVFRAFEKKLAKELKR